jgi:hypothetical protein
MGDMKVWKSLFSASVLSVAAVFSIISCVCPNNHETVTVLSLEPDMAGGLAAGTSQWVYASWESTESYTDVNIEAYLGPYHGGVGTAWLTNIVGWGTPNGSELYKSNFTELEIEASPTWVVLFSGLTLNPGRFYLVIGGDGAVWYDGSLSTVVTGAGVTARETGAVNLGWGSPPYNPIYPPGSDFSVSRSIPPALRITYEREIP